MAMPIATGTTPLPISRMIVATPAPAPDVRMTLVAPVTPLPYSRMSTPRVMRPMISPNCSDPIA